MLGLDSNFQNLTNPVDVFRENLLLTSLEIPCEGPPEEHFPFVIRNCVQNAFLLSDSEKSCLLLMHLQAYKKETALLQQAYFTNLSNPGVFRDENMQFVSDLNIVYTAVKGMVLQAIANYRAGKSTYLFRLKSVPRKKFREVALSKKGSIFLEQIRRKFHNEFSGIGYGLEVQRSNSWVICNEHFLSNLIFFSIMHYYKYSY